jgi:nicotinamide mononucleotide adenylyltransferase
MNSFTVQFNTYSQDMLDILNDNKHLGGTLSCKADKSTTVFFTKRGLALTYLSTMNGLGICGKLITQEPKVATPTENIIAAPVAAHVSCTMCERTVMQKDCWTVKDRGNTTYNCMNEKECKENKRIVTIKKIEKVIIDMPPVEELTELPDRYRDATVWYLHEKTMKVYGKSLFGEMKWKPASKEMQTALIDLWHSRQKVDDEQESKKPQDQIDDEQESKKPQDQ